MHRTHDASSIERAVQAARDAGITNLSLDLIFALPAALERDFRRDVERALALEPDHISLYGHDQYVFLYDNEFGAPWKNPDLWIKFSYPFFHADRIRTPTLFLGGQDDFNVPILGGEQMYQALKTLNVPTQPKLTWNRAAWAVAFDVYLGTSLNNMTAVARVPAVLNENPPQTYSYTPSQALRLSTTYCWKVVSRTFATDVDSTLIASTNTIAFTTGGRSSGACTSTGSAPTTPTGFRIVR